LQKNWLNILKNSLEYDRSAGIIAPRLLDVESHTDSLGGTITFPLEIALLLSKDSSDNCGASNAREVAFAIGAALMVRRELFNKLGGFDSTYFAYREEFDFCWRAKMMGIKVLCKQKSKILHVGSVTLGRKSSFKKIS
jgi:GT2 family glycosyltransferase